MTNTQTSAPSPAPSAADNVPPQTKGPRKRFWTVGRIVDYRFQALAPTDPEDPDGDQDWSDIGADTLCTADREAAYQLARQHDGLLINCDGLPNAARLAAYSAKVKALKEKVG